MAAMMLTGVNAQSRYGRSAQRQDRMAYRHDRMGQRHDRMGQRHDRMTQREDRIGIRQDRMAAHFALDLTEEQQEQLKTLRTEHYEALKPLREKTTELRDSERTLLSEEEVDTKAVHKVIDEQTDLQNQIRKLQLDHRMQVKSIFTEEQLDKLEQRRELRSERRINGNDFRRAPRRGRPYQRSVG